jgi:cell division protein FtsL
MLVNRKQEWVQLEQQEQVKPKVAVASPRPDHSLRRKCLQLIFLVAAVAMIITVQIEVMVRSGYDLVQLKAQTAKLEKENELLRLDIAKLKSPQRIQQIATRDLGMVLPHNTYYAAAPAKSGEEKAVSQVAKGMLNISKAEASKRQ